jgi:cytochrome c-type biogenesis protein
MARSLWRRTVVLMMLGIVAMGAASMAGLWHPTPPTEAMRILLPQVTLPIVLVAGVVDGINPCAFTVLLLFVAGMLATVQAGSESTRSVRSRLLGMGAIYIGAIFLTYLALGVGMLRSVTLLSHTHLPARLAALAAVLLGLWMIKDFFLPELGWRLAAPGRVGALARQAARKATKPALIGSGFLIALCTIPCSGAVYLGVVSLLALQPTALLGYAYLVLYNLMFVVPLVVILLAATSRSTLNRLAHWNFHHKEWVRLVLGTGVVIVGLFVLAAL